MSYWIIFEDPGEGVCGYCGFDPSEQEHHYCDGFGHSIWAATGKVHGEGCNACRQGRFCEKAQTLQEGGVQ